MWCQVGNTRIPGDCPCKIPVHAMKVKPRLLGGEDKTISVIYIANGKPYLQNGQLPPCVVHAGPTCGQSSIAASNCAAVVFPGLHGDGGP